MAKKIWLSEMATRTRTPDRTLRNWWQAYCAEAGLTLTPRQADADHRAMFWDWLRTQGEQGMAAEAQRAAARRRRLQQAACARMVVRVEQLIRTYGFDVVMADVIEPLCTPRGTLRFRPTRPTP
jgi:hypothetical protein